MMCDLPNPVTLGCTMFRRGGRRYDFKPNHSDAECDGDSESAVLFGIRGFVSELDAILGPSIFHIVFMDI